MSETQGGSDGANLQTRAWQEDDDWIIDGHKIWIGSGGIADVHVVNATLNPDAGHAAHGFFVVPGGTQGLSPVRELEKLGCRASHTAEIRFDQVRVPFDHFLGGKARLARVHEKIEAAKAPPDRESDRGGGSATIATFEQTRPMVAAQALGIARAALEFARDYAVDRQAFGGPIMDKQGVSFPLADIAADLDAARLLTWRAAWMAAHQVPCRHAEGSMSKLKASEVAVAATNHAMQVCGGWGYVRDLPVEKWDRDARLYTIFEGTSEIQHVVIARGVAAESGERPPHHELPQDSPGPGMLLAPAVRTFGRGTRPRVHGKSSLLSTARRIVPSRLVRRRPGRR